jgi:hypothetical protein
LREIFQPVFDEIDRLVKEQINAVRVKRLSAGHTKGADIKVEKNHILDHSMLTSDTGSFPGRRVWRESISEGRNISGAS